MNKFSSKLIFGTANLFTKYGQNGLYLDQKISKDIMKFAFKKNIKTLDISSDYKIYNEKPENVNFSKWNISLKITRKILNKLRTKNKIKNFIKEIFDKFNCKKIKYILFHHDKDLFTKNGKLFFEYLSHLKKNNKVSKIGVSIYNCNKLFKILKFFPIDMVQVPYNILDQRLIEPKSIKLIKKYKIEIHVRSIFLQGILVDKKILPSHFKNDKKIKNWFEYISKNKLNPINETFCFINNNKFIKRVVIGVRSKDQLNEILSQMGNKKTFNYSIFKNKNLNIIDPRRW